MRTQRLVVTILTAGFLVGLLCITPSEANEAPPPTNAPAAFVQPAIYQLKPKDNIAIFGDSTTVGGCREAGYVALVQQAITEQLPDQDIRVSSRCGYGATTKNLANFTIGLLYGLPEIKARPPTVAIINLGINDQKSLKPEEYAANLRQGVARLRELGATVMLCTPTSNGKVETTAPNAEAARALAAELKCPVIDLHTVHAQHIAANTRDGKRLPGTDPTCDGCHLAAVGEVLSAQTILRAFGLKPEWKGCQIRVRSWVTNTNKKNIPSASVAVESATYSSTNAVLVDAVSHNGFVTNHPVYPAGSTVTLTCTPFPGHKFVRWSRYGGDSFGENSKLTFTVERPLHLRAETAKIESK